MKMCAGLSTFISQHKIADVTPHQWSPIEEYEACGVKTPDLQNWWDSTRLYCCVRTPICGHYKQATSLRV